MDCLAPKRNKDTMLVLVAYATAGLISRFQDFKRSEIFDLLLLINNESQKCYYKLYNFETD